MSIKFKKEGPLSEEEFREIQALLQKKKDAEPNLNIIPSITHKGYRWRVVWSKVYMRPITETFHEFIFYILRLTLGENWYKEQLNLNPQKRHIILKWFDSYAEFKKANKTIKNKRNGVWEAIPTGEVQALISLAYDIYCLQISNKLPDFIIKRLRDIRQFQGARYEITVASVITRAGFDIDFLDNKVKAKKHCEFIARHKNKAAIIGVEAKSRHRKGVLHEEGQFNDTDIKGDINNLFKKAISQKPLKMPYIIFIDLNLPSTAKIPWHKKPWVDDIKIMLNNYGISSEENPDPFNALIITNIAYHYGGNEGVPPTGEFITILTKYPEVPIKEPQVISEIIEKLKKYSSIPEDV